MMLRREKADRLHILVLRRFQHQKWKIYGIQYTENFAEEKLSRKLRIIVKLSN